MLSPRVMRAKRGRHPRAARVVKWVALAVAVAAAVLWASNVIPPEAGIFAGATAILVIGVASRRQRSWTV